jgi:MFS family permease
MGIERRVSLVKPNDEAGKAWPAIAMGFFVAFGGVLFGYDTGTISGILAMPYWQRLFSTGYKDPNGNYNITTSQESAIVSILSAGTFFGALASPFMSDYIGRRPALLISTWVFNLGVVLQTAATSIPLFLAGRFFAGFGVGLISALSKALPASRIYVSCVTFTLTSSVFSPPLSIRDRTQMDSRRNCRSLPVGVSHIFIIAPPIMSMKPSERFRR